MKKIYITEKQLNEVFDVSLAYLNNTDGETVSPSDIRTQIFTSDNIEGDTPEQPTTDDITSKLYRKNFYGMPNRASSQRTLFPDTLPKTFDKKKVNEANQDLVDKQYNIPNKLYNKLRNNLSQYNGDTNGIKRLKNLINMKSLSTSEMYRIQNRLNALDKSDEEYELIGGDEMLRWINKELKHAKNVSYNRKKINKDLGRENSFISAHNKSSKNGKGHVSNNNVTFNYEN